MKNKIFNKKENKLKICGLLVVIIVLFSTLSVVARDTNEQKPDRYSNQASLFMGEEVFFEEDMENETIPPTTSPWGQWINTTISNQTWYIQETTEGDFATVRRGSSYKGIMDEWLITPDLDFSGYTSVRLLFNWQTSELTAITLNLIDLNVSISTDNGNHWTWLWNENNVSNYWSWNWEKCEIDISNYNTSDVCLGFQFHSSNASNCNHQVFSLDSVIILVNSTTNFWCSCGENETYSWSYNKNRGIGFIGEAGGGTIPYTRWEWDFGDNTGYKGKDPPRHHYPDEGTYNVTLNVMDSATPKKHYAESHRTVTVKETNNSPLKVRIFNLTFGIKAEIKNTETTFNITHINWTIKVEGGIIRKYDNLVGNGTIPILNGSESTTIRSQLFFYGQGFISIRVTVMPSNVDQMAEEVRWAFKLGPLILWVAKSPPSPPQ